MRKFFVRKSVMEMFETDSNIDGSFQVIGVMEDNIKSRPLILGGHEMEEISITRLSMFYGVDGDPL